MYIDILLLFQKLSMAAYRPVFRVFRNVASPVKSPSWPPKMAHLDPLDFPWWMCLLEL